MNPLSVSVLIDLEWSPRSGGHVLCWKHLAEAAARRADGVDLTIHVQGERPDVMELSSNVRFVTHRPVFSSSRLGFLVGVADYTDLAPLHPALYRALKSASVIHTTDAFFAYAKTARFASRRLRRPLVSSLHTDTPSYTRLYGSEVIRNILGRGVLSRALGRWRLPERFERRMKVTLARHLAVSHWALFGERHRASDFDRVGSALKEGGCASILRRGIDKVMFNPARRDRDLLRRRFGIGEDRTVLLFVGRLDEVKGASIFARICRALIDCGRPVHALLAGAGPSRDVVCQILGEHATMLGVMPQEELAWIYASADAFLFPSTAEISPNVVLEAKASGLPVAVARGAGDNFVRNDSIDGLIVASREPEDWVPAIDSLIQDRLRRGRMSRAARQDVERHRPTWDDVFHEDLLPVWRRVADETIRAAA
jgi:glycosyltransferase involved in cell wall biosynthesis